jgi:hypothetical protein
MVCNSHPALFYALFVFVFSCLVQDCYDQNNSAWKEIFREKILEPGHLSTAVSPKSANNGLYLFYMCEVQRKQYLSDYWIYS